MQYAIGDIIKGEVTGIEEYGVFIRLESEYSGLIHISEITTGYVNDINTFVSVGEKIFVRILEINEGTKQVKLSF